MINIFYENKNKRHFRGKKTKVKGEVVLHPHYIVGEDEKTYSSIGITHNPKQDEKHRNYPLQNNPNRNDTRQSYMKKNIETSNKYFYTFYPYKNYKLSKEDEKYVDNLIKMKTNKK